MRVKEKRVLKNGRIAGYVYNSQTKKWKWQFISVEQKGGKKDQNQLFNEYLYLTSEIVKFVDYLYERSERPLATESSKEPRQNLKKKLNNVKRMFNKQKSLMHKKKITISGVPKGTYLDVTYDRIIVLLEYANILEKYNKEKKDKKFVNKSSIMKSRKFHEIRLNNNTSAALIIKIYEYICDYLNNTERLLNIPKPTDEDEGQKWTFIKKIKKICLNRKMKQWRNLSQTIGKEFRQAQGELNEQLEVMNKALNNESAPAAAADTAAPAAAVAAAAPVAAAANKLYEQLNIMSSQILTNEPVNSEANGMVQKELQIQQNELNLLKSEIHGLCASLKQKLPKNTGIESIEKLRQACSIIIKNRRGNPTKLTRQILENIKKALEELRNS